MSHKTCLQQDKQLYIPLISGEQSHEGIYMHRPGFCSTRLVLQPVHDWKPMQGVQDWCYMLLFMNVG